MAQDAYMHSFTKTGAGNWVLPLDSIVQHNPFKVDIAEGTLELQSGSGTLPAMDEPTATTQECLTRQLRHLHDAFTTGIARTSGPTPHPIIWNAVIPGKQVYANTKEPIQ